MSFYWIVPALAAIVAADSVDPPHCTGNVIDRVVITSHSDRPAAFSGFVLTWIILQGRTSDEQRLELYMPYMVEEQFVPPTNSVCKVKFHVALASGGSAMGPIPQKTKLKIVDELSCDSGTFIMKW